MKARSLVIGVLLGATLALTACGGAETEAEATTETEAVTETEVTEVEEEPAYITNEDAPEGMVVSELTGEFIDEAIEKQRPIAVMIDNEKIALPHYGVSEVDIVYKMVNSTHNERVTPLDGFGKRLGKY